MASTAPTTLPPRAATHRTSSSPSSSSSTTQTYLLAYNAISLTLWTTLLFRTAMHILAISPATILSSPTLVPSTRWIQSLAVLEVVHALVGLVRAAPVTTAMQVASRLLLVWGVVWLFGEGGAGGRGRAWDGMGEGSRGASGPLFSGGRNAPAYAGMVAAWAVSEVIRYGYFVCFLLGEGVEGVPKALGWLR